MEWQYQRKRLVDYHEGTLLPILDPRWRTLLYRAGSANSRLPNIPISTLSPLEQDRVAYDLAPCEHTRSDELPGQEATD